MLAVFGRDHRIAGVAFRGSCEDAVMEMMPAAIATRSRAPLSFEECEAARYARDPAFDGVFFIGVRTTGIYCRPVCPARQPLSRNVRYYPSAAAAEAAGLRPCLRCRPETAPFSAAWNGTRTTVGRALRLIEDGALDRGTVGTLAEKLGIGARHLSRLFVRHLGCTPAQAAATARLARAKRLLHDTALPMTVVAATAGFGSLRSFNARFRATYGFAPTRLRTGERRRGG